MHDHTNLIHRVLAAHDAGTPLEMAAMAQVVRENPEELAAALAAVVNYYQRLAADRADTPRPPDSTHLQAVPIGTRIGDFVIEGVLGQGGMGVVYRARQTSLGNRVVALKVLPRSLANRDARFVGRFKREAALAATIHHPNVAELYGFESTGDTLCFAMRLVEGPTLHDVLVNLAHCVQGPVRPTSPEHVRDCVRITRTIADALAEVHARGLVHRDVKPSNIILEHNGTNERPFEGRPVLVDFGLLRPVGDTDLTGSHTQLGTPAYASYDAMLGRDVDARADVFSLAATLHDLLTLTSPETRGPATAGLVNARSINPTVDARLSAILSMALQEKKELRYEHGGAFRDELDCYLRSDSVRALPSSAMARLRLWVRRDTVRAFRVGVFGLAAVLLSSVALWTIGWAAYATGTARAAARLEERGDLYGAALAYRELARESKARFLPWLRRDLRHLEECWTEDSPIRKATDLVVGAMASLADPRAGAIVAETAMERANDRLLELLFEPAQAVLATPIQRFFVREAREGVPEFRARIAFESLTDYLIVQQYPQSIPEGLPELLHERLFGTKRLEPATIEAAITALGALRTRHAFEELVEALDRDLHEAAAELARSCIAFQWRWLHRDDPAEFSRITRATYEAWARGAARQATRFPSKSATFLDSVDKPLAWWVDNPEDGLDARELDLPPGLAQPVADALEWLHDSWRQHRAAIVATTPADPGSDVARYRQFSGREVTECESGVWRRRPDEDTDAPLAARRDDAAGWNGIWFEKADPVTPILSGTVTKAFFRAGLLEPWENPTRPGFLRLDRPGHSLLRLHTLVPENARTLEIRIEHMVGSRSMVRNNGTVAFRVRLAGMPWEVSSIAWNGNPHGRQFSDDRTGETTEAHVRAHVLGQAKELEIVLEYLYGNTTYRVVKVELVWDLAK
ncbi:MAG: serine/threonine protein kinase [Planctomycetes bacterium]|nr:serine/threonine protein kinase [Planctomycetota bacterium]